LGLEPQIGSESGQSSDQHEHQRDQDRGWPIAAQIADPDILVQGDQFCGFHPISKELPDEREQL
jgi:hypothetical protein